MSEPAPPAAAAVESALDSVVDLVETARSLPMSQSCVVHRGELLGLLEVAREALPSSLAQAEQVLLEREALLEAARASADSIVADARSRQDELVSSTTVLVRAREEADALLAAARAETVSMRDSTDDYVDAKLASFEVVLSTTLATVERGRARLSGAEPDVPDESLGADEVDHPADGAS